MKLGKLGGPRDDTLTGYDFSKDKPLIRSRAIRLKCIECCAGSEGAVRNCHISDCALWPYRLGRGICTNFEGVPDAKSTHSDLSDTNGDSSEGLDSQTEEEGDEE